MESFNLNHHPIAKRNPLALAVAAALSFSSPLYADNFSVTQATDNGEGGVEGSLSGAILQANQQDGDDTIILESDVTIDGVMKTLINSNIDVIGNGHFISGNNQFRPLFVKSGTVNLSNMTIRDGLAKGGNSEWGGGGAGLGGALFIYAGNVTIDNVTFENNQAVGGNNNDASAFDGGGGMFGDGNGEGGGGLFASSDASDDGAYGGNGNYGGYVGSSGGYNGGFGGGNKGGGGAGFGGAIFAKRGTLTLEDVTFNNNSASGGEGFEASEDGQGMGGALFICTMMESCYECNAELKEYNVSYSLNTASDDFSDVFISGGSTIYGLHDGGLNDSQLFTINPFDGFAVKALGDTHIGHDLEGLAIHPKNHIIYTSSGDDPADGLPNGHIYEVNPDATLTKVCSTGLRDVSAISFHPKTAELWVWAVRRLFTIDLNDINEEGGCAITKKATLKARIEALTWDNDGKMLYGAADTVLYQYQYYGNGGDVAQVCDDFPSQVEALDMFTDGSLLFGLHEASDTSIHLFDIDECEVKYSAPLPVGTPYTDIEGIAWTCPINN